MSPEAEVKKINKKYKFAANQKIITENLENIESTWDQTEASYLEFPIFYYLWDFLDGESVEERGEWPCLLCRWTPVKYGKEQPLVGSLNGQR